MLRPCAACGKPLSVNMTEWTKDPTFEADAAHFCEDCGEAVAETLNNMKVKPCNMDNWRNIVMGNANE